MNKWMNTKRVGVVLAVLAVASIAVLAMRGREGEGAAGLPAFLNEAIKESQGADASSAPRYTHPGEVFSFAYPEGFTPKLQSDGEDGQVVVVEDGAQGVQIAIVPFDEDIALTPERIKTDIPDLVMERVETVAVAGVQAVAFQSTNASTAASSEVWFVHAGNLYLVSAPQGSEHLISGILTSWKF